jgi:small subunit ribosomal protein S14
MVRDTPNKSGGTDQPNDSRDDQHVCRNTGREQGLVGTYDIWLCRQSFRELAPKIGFKKYD